MLYVPPPLSLALLTEGLLFLGLDRSINLGALGGLVAVHPRL